MEKNLYYIVNVYSACNLSLKRIIWGEILELRKKLVDSPWVIGGDFNSISKSCEMKGSLLINRRNEQREFKEFIEEVNSVDMPCIGNLFTWYNGDGKLMSRIDRFLILDSLMERWGMMGQCIGSRDISDNCLIWLKINKEDWV